MFESGRPAPDAFYCLTAEEDAIQFAAVRRLPDSERLYELVGQAIGWARGEAGLSQTALAKRCGLTRGSIANIELGNQRPTLHTLWTIAEALDVEPRALIPARNELRSPPRTPSDAASSRVRQVVGESSDKVASFIATRRQEVEAHGSSGDREKDKATTRSGRD